MRHEPFRRFGRNAGPILFGTVCLGLLGVLSAAAGPDAALEDAALREAVTDTRFITFRDQLRAEVFFHDDGRVEFLSTFGAFEGQWVAAARTLCLYFVDGPMQGETCVSLTRQSLTLVTDEGTMLVALPSGEGGTP